MNTNDRAVGPPGDENHDPPDIYADAITAASDPPAPRTSDEAPAPEHPASGMAEDEEAPKACADEVDGAPGPDVSSDEVYGGSSDTSDDSDDAGDTGDTEDTGWSDVRSGDTEPEWFTEFLASLSRGVVVAPSDLLVPRSDGVVTPADVGEENADTADDAADEPEPEPESEPEPELTAYAKIADTCTALVDAVAQLEKLEARQAAWKAEFIDRARTLALAAEEGVLTTARSRSPEQRQDLALRSFIAELACTLRVAERTATALVDESRALLHRLPVTLGALRDGEISYRHAQVLVDQTDTLTDDAAAELEERAVPFAKTMPVARFRQKTRMLRERLQPESAVARCRKSVADRRVELLPAPDGMAWVNLFTTAPAAETIFDTIRAQSMKLQSPVESRTLSQLDADVVFAAMMEAFTGEYTLPDPTGTRVFGTGLGIRNPYTDPYPGTYTATRTGAGEGSAGQGDTATESRTGSGSGTTVRTGTSTSATTSTTGSDGDSDSTANDTATNTATNTGADTGAGSGDGSTGGRVRVVTGPGRDPASAFRKIVPTVMVTVPVLTLLGTSVEPGNLDGYGPIDPDTARELASQAPEFSRILTHPETGVALSLGHTKYTPSKAMRRFLRYRDGYCRFPGCTRKAISSDIDHTDPYETGGNTDFDNLASLCPKHHKLKHETNWLVEQLGDGVLKWTSPQGRQYTTFPENPVRSPIPPATAAPPKPRPGTDADGSNPDDNTEAPTTQADEETTRQNNVYTRLLDAQKQKQERERHERSSRSEAESGGDPAEPNDPTTPPF